MSNLVITMSLYTPMEEVKKHICETQSDIIVRYLDIHVVVSVMLFLAFGNATFLVCVMIFVKVRNCCYKNHCKN